MKYYWKNNLLKKKINGGALYIAIMVGIIVSVLLAMFILLTRFNLKQVTDFTQNSQLHINLKSALELAKSSYFIQEWNGKWIKNQVNDDSICVQKSYWGAYTLIKAKTKNRHQELAYSGLYGTLMSKDTGLVVAEYNRPVGLSGAIIFKANCFLSSSGIKPAYIEGQSYLGTTQNSGFVKHSPIYIPEIEDDFIEGIQHQQTELISKNDSLLGFIPDRLDRSFNKSSIVIEVSRFISKLNLKNNIKIISANEIDVDSSCHFENVLIIAKKVNFKQGFKGSVHVIAEDSIVSEKGNVFDFPSSFVISSKNDPQKIVKSIIIGENNVFNGGLIAFTDNVTNENNVFVKLHSTCEVNGLIYSSGYLHLEGKLNANVYCDRLLLKTPSAVYENHMLACEIDPSKYGSMLSIPFIFNKNGKLTLSKSFGG